MPYYGRGYFTAESVGNRSRGTCVSRFIFIADFNWKKWPFVDDDLPPSKKLLELVNGFLNVK